MPSSIAGSVQTVRLEIQVRIPSEFNDDNLYHRDRRGRRGVVSAGSIRRLVRLVIGLVLVVVVMKQAANEAIYRPFFGDACRIIRRPDRRFRRQPRFAECRNGRRGADDRCD